MTARAMLRWSDHPRPDVDRTKQDGRWATKPWAKGVNVGGGAPAVRSRRPPRRSRSERTTMSISVLRLEYRGEHDQDNDQPVAHYEPGCSSAGNHCDTESVFRSRVIQPRTPAAPKMMPVPISPTAVSQENHMRQYADDQPRGTGQESRTFNGLHEIDG